MQISFRLLLQVNFRRALANSRFVQSSPAKATILYRSFTSLKIPQHPSLRKFVKPFLKTFVITAPAFLLIAKQQVLVATENPVNREEMDSAISESDRLCQQNKLKEAYEVLFSHKDVDDVNLQWRFARLCYRMGKMSDSKNPKEFAEMAMKHIDKAVALDSNSFNSQKWRGIILSWYCDFEGYKKKIERSYEIRTNFDAACKLDPNDPTARHLLGRWSYSVADVPWYMKSAAKYILAELPSATYEDALKIFLEAEKIEEGFFSQNWLYIGKCHYSLNNKNEAKIWLKKAAEVVGDNQDDVEARREAKELLKKL